MTTIRASCPDCGDIELPAEQVGLKYDHQHYAFHCPRCKRGIVKKADLRTAQMLISAGVPILGIAAYLEPVPVAVAVLPPLTEDDLIEFGLHFDEEMEKLFEMEGV